jgi:hypothetical protein
MRTTFLTVILLTIHSAHYVTAQVLIAGGSTPPTPVMGSMAAQPAVAPVTVVYQQPVVYVPTAPRLVGGCSPAPNVIYFGGPNSGYAYNSGCGYASGYGRSGCGYNPAVVYFGRGEACQRGYAFSHPR